MKKTILISALVVFLTKPSASAAGGMEVTVLRPHPSLTAQSGPILTLSVFTPKMTPVPGYDEFGAVWLLPLSTADEARRKGIQEFAGAYAGHLFLPWGGWIRPGFHFGWVWQQSMVAGQSGLTPKEGLSFYYGAKVQFSCLTFNLSNKGIGGGINFSL